jgi:hypothetical protein
LGNLLTKHDPVRLDVVEVIKDKATDRNRFEIVNADE